MKEIALDDILKVSKALKHFLIFWNFPVVPPLQVQVTPVVPPLLLTENFKNLQNVFWCLKNNFFQERNSFRWYFKSFEGFEALF